MLSNCYKGVARLGWLLALLAGPAGAQGFEFQAWNARQPVPVFAAADLSGHVWRLSELKGRVVLINFWASWCPPCLAEMPSLQTLAELYGPEKLTVLAVNFKQSVPSIQGFVQRTGLALPVVPDFQGKIAAQWGVSAFPSTVVVGKDGAIRGVLRGEFDWTGEQANRLLQPLLDP